MWFLLVLVDFVTVKESLCFRIGQKDGNKVDMRQIFCMNKRVHLCTSFYTLILV